MARFFVCSDFHGSGMEEYVQTLAEEFEANGIIYCGDNLPGMWKYKGQDIIENILNEGEEEKLENWIKGTENFYKNLSNGSNPVWGVLGNHDGIKTESGDLKSIALELMENSGVTPLHGGKDSIYGVELGGFGGSHKPPESTVKFSEKEIYKRIKKLQGVDVLATHVPPYGYNDFSRAILKSDEKKDIVWKDGEPIGARAGSKGLKKAIEETQPGYNVCGHIHPGVGYGELGNTQIANVSFGPHYDGEKRIGVVGVLDTLEDRMDFYKLKV